LDSTLDRRNLTPLERQLAQGAPRQVTPLDVLAAARRRFLRGERVDMRDLAADLRLSRATLYRWVGSRERLLGEILWSMAEVGLGEAREAAAGARGVERAVHFYERFLRLTAESEPIQRFLDAEREAALRILTSREGLQQRRLIDALRGFLEEEAAAGEIELRLDAGDLAYVMTRIGESFLWREFITGERPDVDRAVEVVRVLLIGVAAPAVPGPGRRPSG
jgi:AcrR family transcriptional regulator